MVWQTRLFKELATTNQDRNCFFIYWCLRPIGASGHPPRSSFFADRLIRQSDVESLFRMLQRVAVLYQQKYGEQELDANREFWKLSGFESDSNGQTWEQHQHRLSAVFSELEKQADDKLEVPNSLRLILCLDEASELLNVNGRQEGQFFRSVRHAAGEAGITLVLADTNSRITNFISPHASHAASSDRWQRQLECRSLHHKPALRHQRTATQLGLSHRPSRWPPVALLGDQDQIFRHERCHGNLLSTPKRNQRDYRRLLS